MNSGSDGLICDLRIMGLVYPLPGPTVLASGLIVIVGRNLKDLKRREVLIQSDWRLGKLSVTFADQAVPKSPYYLPLAL